MHKYVTTQADSSLSDLFTISWSPSHIELCHFKVTVLAPRQWGHQTLSSFPFPTYPHTSCMCSPITMWPKSKKYCCICLDLKSTYEREHTIFGPLSLPNLTQNDVLQFRPFTWEIIFHSSSRLSKTPLCIRTTFS
jgi:hypothetical protein